MKNKWKLAFWLCFALLIGTGMFGFYEIVDQGVTLTYLRESYNGTESDLQSLVEIVNKTDLSKQEIEKILEDHRLSDFMDFKTDTVGLERVLLIFEDGRLARIEK